MRSEIHNSKYVITTFEMFETLKKFSTLTLIQQTIYTHIYRKYKQQ